VLNGEAEKGCAAIRTGIADAQTLHMPYEEALGQYHLGRLLPDDHGDKRAALEQAAALFERLGAGWDAAKAREILSSL